MNSYKLNNKAKDSDFLSFIPVNGKAVFHVNEFRKHPLQENERLVVVLTSGKKYMGKVVNFNYSTKGNFIEGTIEIIRC